ncbi:MAG: HAD-IA family hydrolase [Clostridia bacterium]|nr:HAD-IA family hydrolase [Clostridia bacterium]
MVGRILYHGAGGAGREVLMYKLVIFDMDGTVLDTLEDLKESLNHALAACGMPARSLDEVRNFVGNGIRRLVERGVPAGTSAAEVGRVLACFEQHYALHCGDHTRPYPGIPELLRRLQAAGVPAAVVSNKTDYAVQALCAQYFPGLFCCAQGLREGVRAKPAPDMVTATLQACGVSREQAVFVGDSEVDLATARAAELPCIAVAWGFRGREKLAALGAAPIVQTAEELERELIS